MKRKLAQLLRKIANWLDKPRLREVSKPNDFQEYWQRKRDLNDLQKHIKKGNF